MNSYFNFGEVVTGYDVRVLNEREVSGEGRQPRASGRDGYRDGRGREAASVRRPQGHIPIVVLIDGQYRYTRPDGRVVEFVNFPAAAGNPTGLNGARTAVDLESALLARMK